MKVKLSLNSISPIAVIEFCLITATFFIPLLFNQPYRINLYLAWEGAYRIASGEIPFRDFGMPLGYVFWVVLAAFFKIFGSTVYSLLVAQSVINLISNLLFRQLLRQFSVPNHVRLLSLVVYCFSFSLYNIWPWYNHLVFVIEVGALVVLSSQLLIETSLRKYWVVLVASFLMAATFMTKQDTGGLALISSIVILSVDFLITRNKRTIIYFLIGYSISIGLMIVPFLDYDFLYWFNIGQSPHNARTDKFDIINEFLGASSWIKFYLIIFVGVMLAKRDVFIYGYRSHPKEVFFALVILLILFQASIIQVTSYTPVNGNIYFHSFAFAFFGSVLLKDKIFSSWPVLGSLVILVTLWWSGFFWTRFFQARLQTAFGVESKSEVISKNSYIVDQDTVNMSRGNWVVSSFKSLKRIKIPIETENGIKDLSKLNVWKTTPRVLNMSELTSLAYDFNFKLETGFNYPLWFHRNVAFFDREVVLFCQRINNTEYDLILFQDIPELNNFYPYEVQECIKENYKLEFKFLAPRIPNTSYIEVYTKK
jgi:hypothetical protein